MYKFKHLPLGFDGTTALVDHSALLSRGSSEKGFSALLKDGRFKMALEVALAAENPEERLEKILEAFNSCAEDPIPDVKTLLLTYGASFPRPDMKYKEKSL